MLDQASVKTEVTFILAEVSVLHMCLHSIFTLHKLEQSKCSYFGANFPVIFVKKKKKEYYCLIVGSAEVLH